MNWDAIRASGKWRGIAIALLAPLLSLAGAGTVAGQDQPGSAGEHQVKAVYLYKFAGYVEWPGSAFERPDTPVTFAVIGDEVLATELAQAVAGRTVNERRMVVRRLRAGESVSGIHVLFIGHSESTRLKEIAQVAQSRAILTVTESDGALSNGSVINFVVSGMRVRFEISLAAAEKSGLRLSSRLLAVATQVHPSP